MKTRTLLALCVGLGMAPATVHAQQPLEEGHSPRFLVEATGGWGFQLGETSYLPDGSATAYRHPLVSGYSVGGTVGYMLMPGLALVGNYEYASASTREGNIPGVLDRVEGYIDYHTAVVGLRALPRLPYGHLRLEFGLGVMFPHETRLEYDYGPGLAPAGITGSGSRTENYAWGYGGHALAGYEFPIYDVLYAATQLKLKVFQTTNSGETTEYRNFADLEAQPPMAVDATVRHGDGAAAPTTNSVQEARLQLVVGVRF